MTTTNKSGALATAEDVVSKFETTIPSGQHGHWAFLGRPEAPPFTSKDGGHWHLFLVGGKLIRTEYDGEHRHPVDVVEGRPRIGDQVDPHMHEMMINGNFVQTGTGGAHTHPQGSLELDDDGDIRVRDSGEHRHIITVDGAEYESITADDVLSVETRKNLQFDVQSILFNKDRFRDFEKAAAWAQDNDFDLRQFEERQTSFVFTQNDRANFSQGSLQTIRLAEGVEAVIGVIMGLPEVDPPNATAPLVDAAAERASFDQLQSLLTAGYDVLDEQQETQMGTLKDEFAAQMLALRTAVTTVFPVVMDFVEAMLDKAETSDVAAPMFDRVGANLSVLDDTLNKVKLPDIKVRFDEELLADINKGGEAGVEVCVGVLTDCLEPVIATFDETSFENFSLLLKSAHMTLMKFRQDHLSLTGLKPTAGMDREQLRKAQQQRSEHFGVVVAEGSSLTFPEGFPTELTEYGDPVNLKFPFESADRVVNARKRFKQFANQIYGDEVSKNTVHARIVKRALDFGLAVTIDLNESLDRGLPQTLHKAAGVTVTTEVKTEKRGKAEVEKTWFVPIYKSEQEEQTVFGVVLEPNVTDLHGDTYDDDTVVRAAHNFMENFQNVGLMHEMFVNDEVNILESFVAPTDMVLTTPGGPVTLRKNTWLMKVRILSADLWTQIKTGELTGFSIGALANVQELTPTTGADS